MKINKILLISFLGLLFHCQADQGTTHWLTADFDENEKIYIVHIPQDYVEELISHLSLYEQVGVLVQSLENIPTIDSILVSRGANQNHISYGVFPGIDQWIRDASPAILQDKNGDLTAVDFISPRKAFANNPRQLAQSLQLPARSSTIVAQGGARESNGQGTMIVTKAYYQYMHPEKSQKELTQQLKKDYGVNRIIWLPQGLIEDELFERGPVFDNWYPIGSGGHVDEFCRFISPTTVLLAEVSEEDQKRHPLYAENHRRLNAAYRILRKHKDLKIVRVPLADFITEERIHPETQQAYQVLLATSYLNFIIGNQVVIIPKYDQTGMPEQVRQKDEQIRQTMQQLLPKHKIVQLDPRRLNGRGGGYHCISFQLPKRKKGKKWS